MDDRLKIGADLDFFGFREFTALKCLRNYFHHRKGLKNVVKLVPIGDYPIITDLATLCLVPRAGVDAAIEETIPRYIQVTQQACHEVFHWYGSVVSINPCVFNFVALAYEHLTRAGISMRGDAVEQFEASYRYEEEHDISHFVDGRITTSAGSIDQLLMDIVESGRF